MDFKRLYIDSLFLRSLEKIAVKEGWLEEPEHEHGLLLRNHLRARTLLYLTLFEEVDSPSLLLFETDCSKLINAGIIRKESRLLDGKRSVFEEEQSLGAESHYGDAIEDIKNTTRQLLDGNRWKLINQLYRKVPREAVDSEDTVKGFDISKDYDFALASTDQEVEWRRPELLEMKDTIETARYGLEELFFISMRERVPFVTDFEPSWSLTGREDARLVEEATYIVRTRLQDELLYVPNPQSLTDVIKMRGHPSMRRLRSVLGEWVQHLLEGEHKLERKARMDVRKANRELKALHRWRQYKASPLNFWLNSIGGHIPILSNIVTVVSMVSGLLEPHVERKNSWVMVGKS